MAKSKTKFVRPTRMYRNIQAAAAQRRADAIASATESPARTTRHRPRLTTAMPPLRAAGYSILLLVLVGIGTFFQNASFGTALIIVYGAVALVLRVKSGDSLKMALVTLGYVSVLTLAHDRVLVETFAQYAFLLLLIGVLSLLLEQRRASRAEMQAEKKRPRACARFEARSLLPAANRVLGRKGVSFNAWRSF